MESVHFSWKWSVCVFRRQCDGRFNSPPHHPLEPLLSASLLHVGAPCLTCSALLVHSANVLLTQRSERMDSSLQELLEVKFKAQ